LDRPDAEDFRAIERQDEFAAGPAPWHGAAIEEPSSATSFVAVSRAEIVRRVDRLFRAN
jgi:hypothetical protein